MKLIIFILSVVLTQTFSASAATSSCPLAMIVFVQGGIASPYDPSVLKMRDVFESQFGPQYPLTVVGSAEALINFDYALALTVDVPRQALTANVRSIISNRVLRSESVFWTG